jgi:ERCC4-type nuclease
MFTIIRDTREKVGWDFQPDIYCEGMINEKLYPGDYSLRGLEDEFCIERKSSNTEIARNIVEDRFWREIEVMSKMKWPFLICEFPYSDLPPYPNNLKLPYWKKNKIRVKGPFIVSRIQKIQYEYDIPVIFCRDRKEASEYSYRLMKDIWQSYQN